MWCDQREIVFCNNTTPCAKLLLQPARIAYTVLLLLVCPDRMPKHVCLIFMFVGRIATAFIGKLAFSLRLLTCFSSALPLN